MKIVKIKGMSCQHCVKSVEKALGGVAGVGKVEVSLEKGQAAIEESAPVDDQAVKAAVEKAGFEVV